jgi:hypothetical protein
VGALVILHREANLLEIVQALCATSRFANHLNGGQENPYENANDGNHYQEFD